MQYQFLRYSLPTVLVFGTIACISTGQTPIEVPSKGYIETWANRIEERPIAFDPYKQWLSRGSIGRYDIEQEWATYLLNKSKPTGTGERLESIANAMAKAKSGNDEATFASLNLELEKAVADQFDAIHSERQKELERLEKTLSALRALQEKRLGLRDRIITEKVEQVKRDVEGLGWISPSTNGLTRESTPASGKKGSSNPLSLGQPTPR